MSAITLEEFDINKVVFAAPTTDGMQNTRIPIRYQRNDKEGQLKFQFPIVRTTTKGVMEQKNTGGGASHSIQILFPRRKPVFVEEYDEEGNIIGGHYEEPETIEVLSDPDDPDSELVTVDNSYQEAQRYADIIDEIYMKAVDHLYANRNKLKEFAGIQQKVFVEAQLKRPIYRKYNQGINDQGKEESIEDLTYCPSVFLKFIESGINGDPPNVVYTRFTGVDQKPINWKSLMNTMMYLSPAVAVESIFLGAKKNIQCKVHSSIVVNCKPREELSADTERLKMMVENNPALLEAFKKNLGSLEKYREVIRDSELPSKENKETPESSPEKKAEPEFQGSHQNIRSDNSSLESFMMKQQNEISRQEESLPQQSEPPSPKPALTLRKTGQPPIQPQVRRISTGVPRGKK